MESTSNHKLVADSNIAASHGSYKDPNKNDYMPRELYAYYEPNYRNCSTPYDYRLRPTIYFITDSSYRLVFCC